MDAVMVVCVLVMARLSVGTVGASEWCWIWTRHWQTSNPWPIEVGLAGTVTVCSS